MAARLSLVTLSLVTLTACASDPAPKSARTPQAARARGASFTDAWQSLSASGLAACSADGASADRVVEAFRRAGLQAGFGEGRFQRDLAIYGPRLEARVELDGRQLTIGYASRALPFSSLGDAEAEMAFASYGVVAPDRRRDDFAGVDVKGRVVVMVTGRPDDAAGRGPFQNARGVRFGHARNKVEEAARRGAVGVPDARRPPSTRASIPVVFVRTRDLSRVLEPRGVSLARLQEMMLNDGAPASMKLGAKAKLHVEEVARDEPAWAVAGVSEGTAGSPQHVVVTAGCGAPEGWVPGERRDRPAIAAAVFLAEQFARAPSETTFVFVVTSRSGGAGLAAWREAAPRPLRDTSAVLDVSFVRGRNGPLFASASTIASTSRGPWMRSIALLPDGAARPPAIDGVAVLALRTLAEAPESDDLGSSLIQLLLDLGAHGHIAGDGNGGPGPAGLVLLPAPPPFAGALIDGIELDSAAEVAGLKIGDIVTGVDGAKTAGLGAVLGAVGDGRVVTLTRAGDELELELPAPAASGS
jgi:hypothetical protein